VVASEEPGLGSIVQRVPRLRTDIVPGRVAGDGGNDEEDVQRDDVQLPPGREQPGGDEQRVSGEKEADQETGFCEDDEEEPDIAPPADDLFEGRELQEQRAEFQRDLR
jgi:hypothetical protein